MKNRFELKQMNPQSRIQVQNQSWVIWDNEKNKIFDMGKNLNLVLYSLNYCLSDCSDAKFEDVENIEETPNFRSIEIKPKRKKILSDEHKENIGKANKGKIRSEETKKKLSEAAKNRKSNK